MNFSIPVLLITFNTYYGEIQLFISNEYAYYEIQLDDLIDGTLVDFKNSVVYKIENNSKTVQTLDSQNLINPFSVSLSDPVKIEGISYKGLKGILETREIASHHFKGVYTKIYADIPQIEQILPTNELRKLVPIAVKDREFPFIYQVHSTIQHPMQNGSDSDTTILQELNEIKWVNVDADFFIKLFELPDK